MSSIQQDPPRNGNWFASVAEARDYLRAVELPTGGATVVLHAGYHQPFALSADDSGTPDAPITYTSAAGERAVVSGGISLPGSAFEEWADRPGVLRANEMGRPWDFSKRQAWQHFNKYKNLAAYRRRLRDVRKGGGERDWD